MKKSLAIVLAAALSLSLAACGSSGSGSSAANNAAPAASEAQNGASGDNTASEANDTLRVIQPVDPGTFEPSANDDQSCMRIMVQIYDPLFRFDENGVLQPWLCESYEWDDDTHMRLHIREGVKFSDGSDFTAEDVYWTITRSIKDALPNAHYNIIDADGCELVDDHTVVLALKYPCGTMANHLASDECGMASRKAYEESNGDYLGGAIIGTGPYKLVEYVQGDIIKMTANEYCWAGAPKTKNLEMRIVNSGESRATEAKTLDYDIVLTPNSREVEEINAIDGMHIVYGQTAKTAYILINTQRAPMDNPKVREAFARAIDVNATAKLAYGSVAHPAEAFIVPGILGCNEETYHKYFGAGHDIETAKALLAEAGYPDGIDLELTVESTDTQRADMGEAMQAQVAAAGINLSINKLEDAPMREYLDGGLHQMAIFGFTAQTMEADGFLAQIQPGSSSLKRIGYERPEFFETYQKGCATMDEAERGKVWEECLEMMMEDYVAIPLNHQMIWAAVKDNVDGFWWAKDYEEIYYADISKK